MIKFQTKEKIDKSQNDGIKMPLKLLKCTQTKRIQTTYRLNKVNSALTVRRRKKITLTIWQSRLEMLWSLQNTLSIFYYNVGYRATFKATQYPLTCHNRELLRCAFERKRKKRERKLESETFLLNEVNLNASPLLFICRAL